VLFSRLSLSLVCGALTAQNSALNINKETKLVALENSPFDASNGKSQYKHALGCEGLVLVASGRFYKKALLYSAERWLVTAKAKGFRGFGGKVLPSH
jgi:hypothetical protein